MQHLKGRIYAAGLAAVLAGGERVIGVLQRAAQADLDLSSIEGVTGANRQEVLSYWQQSQLSLTELADRVRIGGQAFHDLNKRAPVWRGPVWPGPAAKTTGTHNHKGGNDESTKTNGGHLGHGSDPRLDGGDLGR